VPSLGHLAVGLAASRLTRPPSGVTVLAWSGALCVASLLPDADVMAFTLGIPYRAPFGHRGASHSLAAAAALGLLCAMVARWRGWPAIRIGLLFAAVMATHGLLDALTDGGLGAALAWPFADARFFAPWRPIPVAPIGAGMLSRRGLEVMATEAVMFLPLFVVGLWPRRRDQAARDRRERLF
jgi:inner membrane protein